MLTGLLYLTFCACFPIEYRTSTSPRMALPTISWTCSYSSLIKENLFELEIIEAFFQLGHLLSDDIKFLRTGEIVFTGKEHTSWLSHILKIYFYCHVINSKIKECVKQKKIYSMTLPWILKEKYIKNLQNIDCLIFILLVKMK